MHCDMCGSEASLVRANIEGSVLNVCGNCAKYGKLLPHSVQRAAYTSGSKASQVRAAPKKPEIIMLIVEDFSDKIKKKREQLGMTQMQLARALAERESLIHKMESGHMKPSIDLARKIERYLRIKLVEQHDEDGEGMSFRSEGGAMTIGDLLGLKNKKEEKA